MPQMSPYNWILLNLLFTMMFLMMMIILNFIYVKKNNLKFNKKNLIFMIKW